MPSDDDQACQQKLSIILHEEKFINSATNKKHQEILKF